MITPSNLEHNSKMFIDKEIFNTFLSMISSFHSSVRDIVETKSLTVNPFLITKYKCNDINLQPLFKNRNEGQVVFQLTGYHREIFGTDSVTMSLPILKEGIAISKRQKYTLYAKIIYPLVSEGFFSDEYFMFIKPFLDAFEMMYDKETGQMGFDITEQNKNSYNLKTISVKELSNFDLFQLEVQQGFVNKTIGDPYNSYGFTHKIRELLGMTFYEWQKSVIEKWSKVNVVFAVRNSGKTAFACYIGLREITSEKTGFGIRKNRKVIYFVPDKVDIGEQIMDYIEGYIDAIFDSAIEKEMQTERYKSANEVGKEDIRYEAQIQANKLKKSYFKIERSKYQIRCNITGNSLKVVSLKDVEGKAGKGLGTSKGEGLACDVYIIDEAPRVSESFWSSFWERAQTESDYGYISGTLNRETPKSHWSYKLAIKGELGNEDISTHRVTLEENENLFIGLKKKDIEGRKEIIERERLKLLEVGIKNLYSRGYGIILDESKVYDVSGNILSYIPKGEPFHHRLSIIDFGGDSDPIAHIIFNINTLCIEEAHLYKGMSPEKQLELASIDSVRFKNITTIGDGTGFGRMIRSIDLDAIIEFYIAFSSGPEWKFNKEKRYYAVDKSYMVDLSIDLIDKGIINIPAQFEDVLDHISNFIKITNSQARVQQYEALQGKHDDYVACLLMLSVFCVKALGITTKEEFQKYGLHLEATEELIYNNTVQAYYDRQNEQNNIFHNRMY